MRKLQEAVTATGNASGMGGCCSPKVMSTTKVHCLKVWVRHVCQTPMSGIVQAVDGALQRWGLETESVGVEVNVDGMVGPRCEATDSQCGPLTWHDETWMLTPPSHPPGCATGRVRIAAPNDMTPGLACMQDGECLIGACGEKCLRWDQPLDPMTCAEPGELEEKRVTYCGCVAGRCDWFRPAASGRSRGPPGSTRGAR